MTSPDLMHELRESRPVAPIQLRARIREISAPGTVRDRSPWNRFHFPVRRAALIAIPATAALAFASAGVLGITRSDVSSETYRQEALADKATTEAAPSTGLSSGVAPAQDSAIGPTTGRAQRVSATLTVEVADADAVSRAAQDALDLTRSLGGHVVSASVATGEEGSAALTVRVPVAKVQE
ncbi:MAG: hypothetical protein ACRDPV_06865, partial [Gaiellaceae bacterium]